MALSTAKNGPHFSATLTRHYKTGEFHLPSSSQRHLIRELESYATKKSPLWDQAMIESATITPDRAMEMMKNQPSYLSTDTETWQVMVGLDCADGDDMAVFSVRLNDGPLYVIGSRPVDMSRYSLWKYTRSISGHRMNVVSRFKRWFRSTLSRISRCLHG